MPRNGSPAPHQKVIHGPDDEAMIDRFSAAPGEHRRDGLQRILADPEKIERDLARLVLGVVELLRQLLEKQAVRRVESGALREDEIERLGDTLQKLETRMGELKVVFGLADRDLTLDLGPLKKLVSDCE